MPVIVVASPKGGSGKSTTVLLLGTELAHAGAKITMLDCDHTNRSLSIWAGKGRVPKNIEVVADVTESSVVSTIKQHDDDGRIVIVDLEGIASRMVSRAISQADLVLIPMQATVLDATIGARALPLIAEEEEVLGRTIRTAVVFTATSGLRSKQRNGIEGSLIESGVDVVEPSLMQRAAYSALFEYGGDLRSMPPQGNMEAAIENASHFAQAIYNRLAEALK